MSTANSTFDAKTRALLAEAGYVIREKESFNHAVEINRDWGCLQEVLDWCKSETQAEWRWQLVDMSSDLRPGRYIFFFDDAKDCCAFALKWR